MARGVVLSVLLLTPLMVLGAGFAPQSIFLSRNPVVEGDTVRIYSITTNTTPTNFSGKVVIKEGTEVLGSASVSLSAGATQTVSVPWTPAAGIHTIVAQLQSTDGTVAEERSATFTIQEKAKETPAGDTQTATSIESSKSIQDQIGSLSPVAQKTTEPVFTFIDGVRSKIADVAESQIAATKPKLSKAPATENRDTPQSFDWIWNIFYTLYFYILTVIRFIVGSAGIFYPILALAFLYFLWKMFRRFRRN